MKASRIEKKMTLRELSNATGISVVRVCALEQKRAMPTGPEVDALARVLGSRLEFAEDEQAKEKYAKMEQGLEAMGEVRRTATARGLGKGRGGAGKMKCPVCGHTLAFSVAGINGHIWAKCTTKNCLEWME